MAVNVSIMCVGIYDPDEFSLCSKNKIKLANKTTSSKFYISVTCFACCNRHLQIKKIKFLRNLILALIFIFFINHFLYSQIKLAVDAEEFIMSVGRGSQVFSLEHPLTCYFPRLYPSHKKYSNLPCWNWNNLLLLMCIESIYLRSSCINTDKHFKLQK